MTSPTRHIRLHATTTEDGKGLRQLEQDLDRAAGKSDKLGHSMSGAERDAKGLEGQIAHTRKEIRNLGEEFDRTGDTSLFGDLRKERSRLRELERIAKEAGRTSSKAFGGGMLDFGGSGIRPMHAAIGGLVAFAAAAAPAIGAIIAGAVTGAVGLGGIAGGIFAASRDPGVERAWGLFAENVSSKFFQMGDSFAEPLVAAAGTLEEAFDNLGLEELFRKVAPYVNDIANGLSGFATNFGIGLSKTLDVAGPALELLGRNLPGIGDALGYMFSRMAEGKGTLEGFLSLISLTEALLRGTGNVIGWLSDRYHEWLGILSSVSGALEDLPLNPFRDRWAKANDVIDEFIGKANVGRQVLYGVERGFNDLGLSVEKTTDAIRKLQDDTFDTMNAQLQLEESNLRQTQAWMDLRESVDEHGHSLARNTEEGLRNHQMIQGLIGGILDIRRANVAAGMAVDDANALFATQVLRLKANLKQLGFTEAQINDLVSAYSRIPTRITTQVITDFQSRGVPAGEHSGPRIGELQHRASGGPVLPGVPYVINERASETVTFPAGGTVHPASLTPAVSNARPLVLNGAGLGDLVFNWIVRQVGDRGGTLAVLGIRER